MSTLNEVKVPDIGDVSEAEIIEISVSVGDNVEIEDTLIVLETDKATMDIPSPYSGKVKEILCQSGDKVSQDNLILILEGAVEQQESEPQEDLPEQKDGSEKQVKSATTNPVADIKQQSSGGEQPPVTEEAGELVKQEVKVPDIGDNNAVEVIEISAHPGDIVEKEDPLIVLETEKATMEIPSPFAGKVIGINVVVGDKVSLGDLVGCIETVSTSPIKTSDVESKTAQPSKPQGQPAIKKTAESQTVQKVTNNNGLVYASPAIRRFARELGADLSTLKGTGTKGRIVKEDVQRFVKSELSKSKSGDKGTGTAMPTMPTIDFSKFGETESVPLSKIQKISSTNLHRNWVSIPHVTQFDDADITEMEAFRQSMKAEAAAEGIKLTPLAFMLKAVVASLQAFPRFNASLAADGENLILKKYFHIGVAVETPDGLVVPVLRDVDKKSVYQLASELIALSAKAREKKLGIDGMQGSCFTISSLGGIGGTAFSPIVNWPDVAILGVSKSIIKPVWDGQEFQPRLMLPLSLSYDHRVIDGAVGARFITHLSKTLGDIRRLVL